MHCDKPTERIWAALKNYVANTAVTWPGRLRQIHSYFRNRSPDQMLATAAPWTSPWLPPGYEQNFWNGSRDAAWAALEQAVIGKAVDLVSGPGGLASFLRRRELGARLGGPSLPLDIGYSETIPPGIRNAVVLRDRKCRWAGGCDQPASACEVHHTKHKANGGMTSTADCVLCAASITRS